MHKRSKQLHLTFRFSPVLSVFPPGFWRSFANPLTPPTPPTPPPKKDVLSHGSAVVFFVFLFLLGGGRGLSLSFSRRPVRALTIAAIGSVLVPLPLPLFPSSPLPPFPSLQGLKIFASNYWPEQGATSDPRPPNTTTVSVTVANLPATVTTAVLFRIDDNVTAPYLTWLQVREHDS